MADDKDILDALLRDDFKSFLMKCFETLNPGRTFIDGWHIDAIVYVLEKIHANEITQQLIAMPPRYLKSSIISVAYTAWVLGQDPTMRIICASYSDDLARKFSEDVRRIMRSSWYKKAFPKTRLAKVTQTELTTTEGGYRLATSVEGVGTGRGGDLIVIDDPIKMGNVFSEAERKKVNRWFDHTMSTRLDDEVHGAFLIVMQRAHENDLIGHLLEKGDWDLLKLAAIASEAEEISIGPNKIHHRKKGEALHPQRQTKDMLLQRRKRMGSLPFQAQFQQDPVPAGGNTLQRKWFGWCDAPPAPETCESVIQSWDVGQETAETNSYSVCTTWGISDPYYFLLDVVRIRADLPTLVKKVNMLAGRWHTEGVLIEDIGPGKSLHQALGRGLGYSVCPVRVPGSKEDRADQAAVVVEAGQVVLPKNAPWLGEYLREMLAFPSGRFDDQVDSTSQFLIWQRDRERRKQAKVYAYAFGYDRPSRQLKSTYYDRMGGRPPF